MKPGTLGILLTTGPDHPNTATAIGLARAARELGKEVSIFIMHDGVRNVRRDDFLALHREGVTLTACAVNAEESGLPKVEGVHYGSQLDLAGIAQESEKFLSLTR
jgi:predicted peroxiredoxin